MKILVSIVNYNSRDHMLACLKDIFEQKISDKHHFKVVVFDNASPDKSARDIKEKFPKIQLVENSVNLGFGKAHNKVAKQFLPEFDGMLLVNPDTRFEEEAFEKLFDSFEKNKDCGVMSTKIVSFDGKADSNGGDFPFGLALFSWLFNLEILGIKKNFHRLDKEYFSKIREVDWVGGTFMLIRKEVVEKVGLFNEEYFMYFEDVDFCYKVEKAGFKIMLIPDIEIKHASGGSSNNNPRFFQWSNEYKNLLLFYRQNFGLLSAFWVKILVYLSVLGRLGMFGLLGRIGIAKTYWKVLTSI